jgi:hypothetical protein
VFRVLQIDLAIPGDTALGTPSRQAPCKRAKTLDIALSIRKKRSKINVIVDSKRGMEQVIPPRKDAKIKRHSNSKQSRLERDEAVCDICKLGRAEWKRRIGYHRRSLVETAMFRLRCSGEGAIFGGQLKNRLIESQKLFGRSTGLRKKKSNAKSSTI